MNPVLSKRSDRYISGSERTCSDVPHLDSSVLASGEDELVAVRERSREEAFEDKTLNSKIGTLGLWV